MKIFKYVILILTMLNIANAELYFFENFGDDGYEYTSYSEEPIEIPLYNPYLKEYRDDYPLYIQHNTNVFDYQYMDRPVTSIFSKEYINDRVDYYKRLMVVETSVVIDTFGNKSKQETASKNIQVLTRDEMEVVYAKTVFNCPIEGEYSNNNLLWASILFESNSHDLSKDAYSTLGKTVNLQRNCNKRILLMAHNSQYEINSYPKKTSITDGIKLAQKRADIIVNEMIRGGVPSGMIEVIVCGRTMPRYLETSNTKNAAYGNQRVDIIIDKDQPAWLVHGCTIEWSAAN